LDAKEQEHWREKLQEEASRIRTELEALREITASTTRDSTGDLSSHASHMADLGTDAMEREKAFLFASQKRKRLDEIGLALERIEAGTFGFCESCGQEIPPRRLERMPGATTCVPCKEKEEKKAPRG
jgi:RNA polymerase-binding protein DksA